MWYVIAFLHLSNTVLQGELPSLRTLGRTYRSEALGWCTKARGRLKAHKGAPPARADGAEVLPCRGIPKQEVAWPELLSALGRHEERAALERYDDWAWPLRVLAYGSAAAGLGFLVLGTTQDETAFTVGGVASLGLASALGLMDLWLRRSHVPNPAQLSADVDAYNARLREELLRPLYDDAAERGDTLWERRSRRAASAPKLDAQDGP